MNPNFRRQQEQEPKESIYDLRRRGESVRNLVPWGQRSESGGASRSFAPHDEATTGSSQLISNNTNRSFFELQNNSAADDMRLNIGSPATIGNGIVVVPGGSVRWEVQCPQEDLYLFCAVAGQPFTWTEAV